MFAFSPKPIDSDYLKSTLTNPKAGALSTFEGLVRNHNDGRTVLNLQYEAYEALGVKEAARIIDEAKEKYDVYDIVCVHRIGSLAIGDLAVWMAVSAAHRGAAFGACQYVIDQIKLRLPIWKKETYVDGSSGWVNCHACSHAGHEQESPSEEHNEVHATNEGPWPVVERASHPRSQGSSAIDAGRDSGN